LNKGIKIAIGGKGGVGKTTVCAVWAKLFAEDGLDVLAVDADPDTNLCSAFGITSKKSPEPLIKMKQLIAERTGTGKDAVAAYFRLNPKVSDLPEKYSIEANGLKLLVLGGITQAATGCACAESAFLKALLTCTILHRNEAVIIDLDAGVEFMGRASVQGIDALVVVVEPGTRSIETALNISQMAEELGIKNVAVIANKITEAPQIDMIKSQLKDIPLLACLDYSKPVRQADIEQKAVFNADAKLVSALKEAKVNLLKLINPCPQQHE